jgi:hypothetical protein
MWFPEVRKMLCYCGKELKCGAVLTEEGNKIDYSECEDCGIVEVMGMEVRRDSYRN